MRINSIFTKRAFMTSRFSSAQEVLGKSLTIIYPPDEYKQVKHYPDILTKVFSEQLVFVEE